MKDSENKWKLPKIPIYGDEEETEIIGFSEFKWEYPHQGELLLVDDLPPQKGRKFLSIRKMNPTSEEMDEFSTPWIQIRNGHVSTHGYFPRQIVKILMDRYAAENSKCKSGKQKFMKTFWVRGYDEVGYFRLAHGVSHQEAQKRWNEATKNGTQCTKYEHGTYYKIFPLEEKHWIAIETPGKYNEFGELCCEDHER